MMTLEDRVQLLLIEHDYLKENDQLLCANVWKQICPNRYDFHQFLYKYSDGLIPSETQILKIKTNYLNQIEDEKYV